MNTMSRNSVRGNPWICHFLLFCLYWWVHWIIVIILSRITFYLLNMRTSTISINLLNSLHRLYFFPRWTHFQKNSAWESENITSFSFHRNFTTQHLKRSFHDQSDNLIVFWGYFSSLDKESKPAERIKG